MGDIRPLKINNVDNINRSLLNPQSPEVQGDGAEKALLFRKTLNNAGETQLYERMTELVAKIDEQGARLIKRADVKELEKYRSLIREFMEEVVSNGFEFSKENRFLARGRHKSFATVKVVNQKLDELAKVVLSEQKESIDIVNRVDDIRGLLLDMLL